MASSAASSSRMASALLLLLLSMLSFALPSALAAVICEDLPQDLCAFAISASSKRCLLESTQMGNGRTVYQCHTSEVVVERMSNWIETDECVRSCGVDRSAVGISSDSLLEPQLREKLCSPACHENCPNIIDLYFNLAAGEGVFLPDLCQAQRANPHRAMAEILSSGVTAPGPASSSSDSATSPAAPPSLP